ncbi:carbonic anhydrase 2-like [Toxorhynchites rutilus septentrionalis]|uniref:carbonic anhydrase 2-like n=1 Tax=Toxorhynchites rutilus septentrionalis TaxID=329112 RepID=UPI00247985C3|nr:carbonic anhydrase 2-like [Toxorhynchites rutilus septentrionalis]XP_055615826.1 carbonic anhydrase 2-like [Toxorhynchites rutilus septentrionalis]XP_055615827.1 carbonic anhydrase 2-like [Toxorhynchites rutilus septentrionalis]XP_055615830.1 carbonic anhydrase 2-like [Toxorhynchites rutilus septentrionalis]XP_055615831.1 carbonic anhydrase 2-like [Toxorhynchites rutilus septentrionalis]
MRYTMRQYHFFLLNYLMFIPWLSCSKLDFYPDYEEDIPRLQSHRRLAPFDEEARQSRGNYRNAPRYDYESLAASRQPHRFGFGSNPDFYFPSELREEGDETTDNDQVQPLVRQRGAHIGGAGFSYKERDENGPSNWHRSAAQCGGAYQSPIALETKGALYVRNKRPLALIGQTNLPQGIRLQNDGHSAKFTYNWSEGDRPYIRGGPLKNKYYFEQFHFHWGANNTVGSEHVMDHQRYPMELHLVFYNALYSSYEEARTEPHGLVVVGMFYEIYHSSDVLLNTWTRFLRHIVNPNTEYRIQFIDTFPLYDLIGDMEWPYFSYEGSLTTPPCLETVTWIVSAKPLLVTNREMRLFRRLRTSNGMMVNNFRPLQRLFNRRVYRY